MRVFQLSFWSGHALSGLGEFGDLVEEASPPASFDGAAVTLVLIHQLLSQKTRIDLVVTSAFLSLKVLGVQRDDFLPGHLGCDVRLYGGGNVKPSASRGEASQAASARPPRAACAAS
jgi:hypothetical protein